MHITKFAYIFPLTCCHPYFPINSPLCCGGPSGSRESDCTWSLSRRAVPRLSTSGRIMKRETGEKKANWAFEMVIGVWNELKCECKLCGKGLRATPCTIWDFHVLSRLWCGKTDKSVIKLCQIVKSVTKWSWILWQSDCEFCDKGNSWAGIFRQPLLLRWWENFFVSLVKRIVDTFVTPDWHELFIHMDECVRRGCEMGRVTPVWVL